MSNRALILAALLLAAPLSLAQVPVAAATDYRAGAIEITEPWTRATAPGATVGAVYLTLTSMSWADELVSAETTVAGKVEFHSASEEGGVAKMRAVEQVAIKAGETVVLAPGGLHLMLMSLKAPLVEGKTIPLTLTFKRGRSIDIKVPVRALGAGAEGGAASPMGHGSMPGMNTN
jgi:copper(I)-binding protein